MNETTALKQTKFYGEVSPLLYGDTANPKYAASLRTCKCWIPTPQGPLVKTPGTQFLGNASTAGGAWKLIPFVFSDGQTFVLELGVKTTIGVQHGTINFWQNGQFVGTDGALHTGASARYQLLTPFSDIRMFPFLKFAQIGDTITICYGGQVPGVAAVAPQDLVHTGGALIPWTIGATPLKIPINNVPPAPAVNISAWLNTTTYAIGDQVSQNHILWTSIQDSNVGNSPPAAALNAAGTGLNGNLWWTPSVDPAHPAVTRAWVYTAKVQDPNGVTYETGPSAITSGTGPLSTDRKVPLLTNGGFTAPLPAGWTLLLYRLYASNGAAQIFGWLQDIAPPGIGTLVYDTGVAPDYTQQPPHGTDPFLINGADSFPSVIGYLDQRRVWSASALRPITTNLSKAGDLYNYDNLNSPGADTDAFNFDISSEVLEQTRAFRQMTRGIALTGQGEYTVAGLTGGPVVRSGTSTKRQSKWGSSWIDPIVIGTGLVFNTAKSNQVRDLCPLYGLYSDIWDGQDLSVLVRHLLDYHVIKNWAFQTVPYPVLWVLRDDGVLISMTYQHAPPSFGQTLTEGVVAWAQHPTATADVLLDLCVVPEPPNDALYLVANRNGANGFVTIERAFSPVPAASPYVKGVADPRYAKCLNASVQYDGHNDQLGFPAATADMNSVAVPGSTNPANYQPGAQVVVHIGSATPFVASDALAPYGSAFVFDPENTLGLGPVKAHVVGFTDTSHVIAELDTACTQAQVTAFFGAGVAVWAIAKGQLAATHLSGIALDSGSVSGARGVSALVDGDRQIPAVWDVAGAGVAFFQTPGVVINLGLSYNSDVEQMDAFHPSAEIRNKYKNVHRIGVDIAGTRSLWFGKDSGNLTELPQRLTSDNYAVMGLRTGYFEQFVTGEYNKTGRAFIRHWEPLPAILSSITRELKLGDS